MEFSVKKKQLNYLKGFLDPAVFILVKQAFTMQKNLQDKKTSFAKLEIEQIIHAIEEVLTLSNERIIIQMFEDDIAPRLIKLAHRIKIENTIKKFNDR